MAGSPQAPDSRADTPGDNSAGPPRLSSEKTEHPPRSKPFSRHKDRAKRFSQPFRGSLVQRLTKNHSKPSWWSVLRGAQSAVHHYLSCAPCYGHLRHRSRRKQAKQDEEKRRQQMQENPDQQHYQVAAYTINPFWDREIATGPSRPLRRRRRTMSSNNIKPATSPGSATPTSRPGSSANGARVGILHCDSSSQFDDGLDRQRWHTQPRQREDEELWGSDADALAKLVGSSVGVVGIGRPETSQSSVSSNANTRRLSSGEARPVICAVQSKPSKTLWMVQPPPVPSVMMGFEPPSKSRTTSRSSSRMEPNLRQLAAKNCRGNRDVSRTTATPSLSWDNSPSLQSAAALQSAGRSGHPERSDTPQEHQWPALTKGKRDKHANLAQPDEWGKLSDGDDLPPSRPISTTPLKRPRSRMPGIARANTCTPELASMRSSCSPSPSPPSRHASSNAMAVDARAISLSACPRGLGPVAPDRRAIARTAVPSSDRSTLHLLQELVSPRALLASKFVSSPLMEARISLPPADADEEKQLVGGRMAGVVLDVTENTRPSGSLQISVKGEWLNEQLFAIKTGLPSERPSSRWSTEF